ncbi:MAG TPA: FtsX-like permease family protein [Chitinophagaceae bacterium]|nr:FtsX-like permease family protein [Chitinophagaceae bacterium]
MLKNYLLTALRHIKRNKAYTLINITGLAMGICGCLVIFLITSYHLGFDNFHPDIKRVYCVDIYSPDAHNHEHWNLVPSPMPAAMRREMPGFEQVAAFQHYGAKVSIPIAGKDAKKIDAPAKFIITEPQYFNILQYTWLAGSPRTSLNRPNSVVLTESRAHTYFGNVGIDKMMGRTVMYDDSLPVTVTGILQDWEGNSNFNFSDFISYTTIEHSFLKNDYPLDNWNELNHASQMLVKLSNGVAPQQIDALFPTFIKKHLDPDPHSTLQAKLQPFSGIHFHQEYGGEGEKASLPVLYVLSGIAIFILLIAAFNFINLSTAQAVQRTKEIGIRKVLGSSKSNLILQFLTETFIISLAAIIVAVICITPVLKAFADYVPDGVKFAVTDVHNWLFLLSTAVIVTLLAGLYPAGVLSRFVPVASLKGVEKTGGKGYLRKALIVFQFSISIIFIIGAIVAGKQVSYMTSKDLGFKTAAVITLRPMWNDPGDKMKVLAQKVSTIPGADKVILQAFSPMGFAHMTTSIQLQGTDKNQIIEASEHCSNEDFVPFYGMKILAGRNLLHGDSTQEYLINQTCARALGFTDYRQAIGKMLVPGGSTKASPIVGVVGDFYENSFREKIPPAIITHDPTQEHCIAIKTNLYGKNAGDLKRLITGLEKQWKTVYPEEVFDYSFLDDAIKRLYDNDLKTQWLINTATLIAIFISCMGLLGLAMFTAEKRTKEIGIRKVLGASVINIIIMLSREVAVVVLLSLVIASPIAGLLMQQWLQGFAYHASINIWVFVFAGAGALAIAMATIGFKAVKAALANPVTALKNE